MNIKLVVFDVATTTVMDNSQVKKALYNAFLNAGYTISNSQINKFMGCHKTEAIKKILNDFLLPSEIDRDLIEGIYKDFTNQVVKLYCFDNGLRPLPLGSCKKIIKVFEE